MSEQEFQFIDLLPGDVSVREAAKALRNPRNIDFHRFLAKILENTKEIDAIQKHVDVELLIKEYQKIRNHMKHGKLDESTRDYWDQKVQELAREFGVEEAPGGSSNNQPPPSSTAAREVPQQPVEVDPSEVDLEDSPSSADGTEKSSKTATAGGTANEQENMMAGVNEDVEFTKDISEASKKVSKELRKLRQKRGVSRNELANNADIPIQTISEIERGRKELTYQMIERFVNGLDMNLQLDFQRGKGDSEDVLKQVKNHIDKTFQQLDIPEDLARPSRIILHQLAEDGMYQKRFPTLLDALNYLEEAVKNFSIQDDAPDHSLFSNSTLFDYLKSKVQNLDYSDIAFDENVKIIAQKLLERYHNN